ncbi:LytR/AlgR family response regulator transcription factor [Marinigracilibium pacificum]|uniref:HTH LytTR-type domain-containing protein n=1 Tax=Marinigracilibium pacificum TaxID=2729599 RepID=A0A848J1I2_9BACT|nr:LytTR family DNA-binding domain-containing protein [Marinigracilibium pacificum]NMM50673.1 hypothetical protein [Marinigracilibium pacificum]
MTKSFSNPKYHFFYWILVIVVLTLVFGLSWKNNIAAFFFISMLLPIVLGTSYFFNYVLVPRYFMKKKYFWFGLYTFYTIVVSLYLELFVIMFSYIYLGNFNFEGLGPNITNIFLMAAMLYLLVFVGSFLLMSLQIKEHQNIIQELMIEKEKMEVQVLELISNRKKVKIPYDDIVYIESFSDYINVHTENESITSKEKISAVESMLPDMFIRIHRSFIINKNRLKEYSYSEVMVDNIQLNIGRTYRKQFKEAINNQPN